MNKTLKRIPAGYLWLAVSVLCYSFANGNAVPVAAWLGPLFFMRFLSVSRSRAQFALGIAGMCAAHVASLYTPLSNNSIPPLMRVILGSAFALVIVLPPFLFDRFFRKKFGPLLGTLVFPAAVVSVEYIHSAISPFATFGMIAYTQYGNLPLMQIVSVTGIWGLSFLVAWFAPVVNHAWESGFRWERCGAPVLACASVFIAVLSFGGLRLLDQGGDNRVKIAVSSLSYNVRAAFMGAIKEGMTPDRETSRKAFDAFFKGISRTDALIAVWEEYALVARESDVNELIAYAAERVKRRGIYCTVPIGILLNIEGTNELRNTVFLIDPRGAVVAEYVKSFTAPWETSEKAVKEVATVETENARLALAICFDIDFPSLIRQAGKEKADIMLVPSYDWRGLVPFHSHMAVFRAVENGFTVVRAAGDAGLTIAANPYGRTIGSLDNLYSAGKLLVVDVPVRGVRTVYSIIGDVFAWLCMTITAFFIGALFLKMRGARVR